MRLAPLVKPLGMLTAATVVTAVSISVFALSPQFGGSQPPSAAPSTGLPAPAQAPADEVPAKVPVVAAKADAPQPVKSIAPVERQKAASMFAVAKDDSATVITFVRPEGAPPSWLRAGSEDSAAREKVRQRCRELVTLDFKEIPLQQALKVLGSEAGVDIVNELIEFDAIGVDPDIPITLSLKEKLPLGDALEAILGSLGLTYQVQAHYVKVTSTDDANSEGTIRYYDLAFVLPTSAGVNNLVQTIQMTVTPDEWVGLGTGTSTIGVIGSMMVVNAPETSHRQIEKMLAELAKTNPENLRSTSTVDWTGAMGGSMGGMGRGMGGMGIGRTDGTGGSSTTGSSSPEGNATGTSGAGATGGIGGGRASAGGMF